MIPGRTIVWTKKRLRLLLMWYYSYTYLHIIHTLISTPQQTYSKIFCAFVSHYWHFSCLCKWCHMSGVKQIIKTQVLLWGAVKINISAGFLRWCTDTIISFIYIIWNVIFLYILYLNFLVYFLLSLHLISHCTWRKSTSYDARNLIKSQLFRI